MNWSKEEVLEACIRGIERSFFRYASSETIKLAVGALRKRVRPSTNEDVEMYLYSISSICPDFFIVEPMDRSQRSFTDVEGGDDQTLQGLGVESAHTAPEVELGPGEQPEEEARAERQGAESPSEDARSEMQTTFVQSLSLLTTGEHTVLGRMLCGSSKHGVDAFQASVTGQDTVLKASEIIQEAIGQSPAYQDVVAKQSFAQESSGSGAQSSRPQKRANVVTNFRQAITHLGIFCNANRSFAQTADKLGSDEPKARHKTVGIGTDSRCRKSVTIPHALLLLVLLLLRPLPHHLHCPPLPPPPALSLPIRPLQVIVRFGAAF